MLLDCTVLGGLPIHTVAPPSSKSGEYNDVQMSIQRHLLTSEPLRYLAAFFEKRVGKTAMKAAGQSSSTPAALSAFFQRPHLMHGFIFFLQICAFAHENLPELISAPSTARPALFNCG